jgi:hypothetical protein
MKNLEQENKELRSRINELETELTDVKARYAKLLIISNIDAETRETLMEAQFIQSSMKKIYAALDKASASEYPDIISGEFNDD